MAKKRGRPRLAHAKRRTTTRQGRRTGLDPVDEGAPLLRAKKRAATSRDDVEMTPAGILFGRGHLDNAQYSALAYVTLLLRRTAAAMGGNLTVQGLWQAMLGATTPGRRLIPAQTGDAGARARLARITAQLDGCRNLVLERRRRAYAGDLRARAAAHRLIPRDLVQLELLRHGLDGIGAPAWWGEEVT